MSKKPLNDTIDSLAFTDKRADTKAKDDRLG